MVDDRTVYRPSCGIYRPRLGTANVHATVLLLVIPQAIWRRILSGHGGEMQQFQASFQKMTDKANLKGEGAALAA
jgi:hypothetical protein